IQMHTVYARCYAIGILVLFIICSIYPQRKSRPVLYPFLIILLANTSIIACLAAFALGLIYCCEAFLDLRNKKITRRSLVKPFIVFSLGSIVILAQMINPQIPFYVNDMEQLFGSFRYEVLQMSDYWPRNISLILFALLLIGSFWFFREDKKPCYFLLISTALLILVALTVYTLHIWHYLLLFVFFVSAMWIYLQENKIKTLYQKIYYGLFILLSFCCIFFARYPWIWNGFHMSTAKYLKVHQEEYKGAKIFLYPVDSSIIGIVPLFKDSDIDFYGPRGTSYNSCETYVHQWDPERIDFSAIRQVWLNNLKQLNKSFIFVSTAEPWKNDLQDFLTAYQKDNGGIKIYEYAGTNDVRIFKIY
ncbi:MAG: hypothetical protein IKO06_04465, partial [Alphaproteobacteria bacterium]|nr:hypothetical protein [Alphaproteobacteria bacterium]